MSAPVPAPRLAAPRLRVVRFALALGLIGAIAVVASTCSQATRPEAPKGTCIRPDNTVHATNITQTTCTDQCPTCTWVQNQ